MKFTEEQLKQYAAPLSETENQKCLNAIRMVREALTKLGFLDNGKEISKMYEDTYAYFLEMRNISGTRKIRLFIQGSYANNTNVRTEMQAKIKNTRTPFSIDFGVGDVIVPKQEKRKIPTQLDDFDAPIINTYSYEYCPDIKVIVNDENGNLIKVKAKDLLPFAWESVIC